MHFEPPFALFFLNRQKYFGKTKLFVVFNMYKFEKRGKVLFIMLKAIYTQYRLTSPASDKNGRFN